MFGLMGLSNVLRQLRTPEPVSLTLFAGKYTVQWTNNEPNGYAQVRIDGNNETIHESVPGITSWGTAQTSPNIEVRFRVRNRFSDWVSGGL